MISIIFLNEYIDDVVEEVNAKEALKSSIFVVQKAAATKTGVESRQSSIGTIRRSLATWYYIWKRQAMSLTFSQSEAEELSQNCRQNHRQSHRSTECTQLTYCQALLYEQRP